MNRLSIKITELITQSRQNVVSIVNSAMVYTYFEIGKMIVEELQNGEKRANYGKMLLKETSKNLSSQFGKGFSVDNLERMRKFYTIYSNSANHLRKSSFFQKSASELRIFNPTQKITHELINFEDKSEMTFLPLSWSHYLFLLRIENDQERQFYKIESYTNNWKLKELQRQFNTGLYERLLLSRGKSNEIDLSINGQTIEKPQDIIKDPLVLEFLGLQEKEYYSESDLETSIINEIEQFMLELGKGFFFSGRQVRFSFDEEHFRVDLVFYNRLLECFVLIDLKIGKLTHQDLGQMQMYVNYYDRYIKSETENATIGIVLCKDKNNALVEITLPQNNNQIYATKYQTIIPNKEDFQELLNHHN